VKNGEKETMSQQVTGVVFSNGYFPIWSHETFTFTVENWSIGMLQVTVMDKQKEEFIASASIPIPCLRRGIRSVKLCDATNTRSGAFDFAALLLDIEIGQMVAEI
jgi:phosphatidylinositol phospholipase C delta